MSEAEFSPVVLSGDLKDNVSACPLVLVFDEVNLAIQDMPHNLLPRHEFSDLLSAIMGITGAKLKLSTEFISAPLNVFGPPATNVVHGSKNWFGRLVHRKSGV